MIPNFSASEMAKIVDANYTLDFGTFQRAWLEASAALSWPDHYEEPFTPLREGFREKLVKINKACYKLLGKRKLMSTNLGEAFITKLIK
jgi:hypothetical protein